MKLFRCLTPVALALSLVACGHSGHKHTPPAPEQKVERFSCENGLSVQVRHLDTNRIEVRLDDKSATLAAAVTGSGERYVADSGLFGRGAEWHQKGGSAIFNFTDSYGNAVETTYQQQ